MRLPTWLCAIFLVMVALTPPGGRAVAQALGTAPATCGFEDAYFRHRQSVHRVGAVRSAVSVVRLERLFPESWMGKEAGSGQPLVSLAVVAGWLNDRIA